MGVQLDYPHIVKNPGEPARLRRTPRVRIAQIVMDFIFRGWSPEEMCRQYPHLSLPEAYTAMAYYFDHPEEIDAEIEEECKEAEVDYEKARTSPLYLKMKAKGLI